MERDRKTIVILLVITILGLFLRLWGLGHGLDDELFTHPDETHIAFQSEDFAKGFFSLPEWNISPLWTYLQALGAFLYSLLEDFIRSLSGLGQSFVETLNVFKVLFIGRIIAGIIGTMTIPLIYLAAKRLYDERIGLVGATIMSVMYVHVVQSHYSYLDVPQTFFLMISFYFMVMVSTTDNTRHSFLAGIFLGLAVATKISAAPGFISLIFAHYLREKGFKKIIRSKSFYISILGLILGYGLCVPYYWINPELFLKVNSIYYYKIFESSPYGSGFDFREGFIQESSLLYEHLGSFLLLLFLSGLLIGTLRKDKKILFLLSFPLAYLPFTVVAAWHDERELVPILPFFGIVMAYGLTRVVELLPFKRKEAIMAVLSLLFIFPSLWLSLKAGYFFWQKDTRVLAAEWIKDNLPLDARIGMEGYTMYTLPIRGIGYQINMEFSEAPLEEIGEKVDFIVISSTIYNNLNPEKKRYYDSLKAKAQLIKVFETFQAYFINPRIEIYRFSQHRNASSSTIPRTYSETDSYRLSCSEGAYGKEPLSFWIKSDSRIKRVLISEKSLETIGIFFYNGSEKTKLGVKNGFIKGEKISLEPYEKKVVILNPNISFPFIKYIYNISISCRKGRGTFVSILTDQKRIANALIELGEWKQAISILSKKGSVDKEEWSLSGIAYSMGGKSKEALEAFKKGLAYSAEFLDTRGWGKTFERLTDIDSIFLKDSLTVRYGIDQFNNLVGKRMVSMAYLDRRRKFNFLQGWMAYFNPKIDSPGVLLYGPYKRLPAGSYKAVFSMRVAGSGEKPAARIDVFNGDSILSERVIKDTEGRFEEFSLNFYNEEPYSPLEFRVEALGGRELWVEEVKVFPDIQGHYKRFFGMIHHYWGLSAGNLDLREEAIEHFKIAGLLGYNETEGLYQMAGVYERMGMKEESIRAYRNVLNNNPNHVNSLLALKRLSSQNIAEIEKRIGFLTPERELKQGFGDSIEFIGYSIDKEEVNPGGEFRISYFWRPLKKLRTNYSIFVHFRRDGTTVFQNDHTLSFQMKKWKEGEVVKEDYITRVPEDIQEGRYDMIIGLWDPEGSKERLRLKGKVIDEIKIGSIDVFK